MSAVFSVLDIARMRKTRHLHSNIYTSLRKDIKRITVFISIPLLLKV